MDGKDHMHGWGMNMEQALWSCVSSVAIAHVGSELSSPLWFSPFSFYLQQLYLSSTIHLHRR